MDTLTWRPDLRRTDHQLRPSRRIDGLDVERWLPYDDMVFALFVTLFVDRRDVAGRADTLADRVAIAESMAAGWERQLAARTARMSACPPASST